ncbi:YggU-like protein [Trichodelitschia bisporula]|uniref:YggU-like protein n=1 Tax=Trichodelitschia bisporula TaxID=703511 RepID=A0A6G1I2E8_9PEZI|nr:YggU-like protein [Trichodelitschia bisporula]
MPPNPLPTIRFLPSKPPSPACLHLTVHVKPSARKQRDRILSLAPSAIELCVSAPARDGEANKAVRELIAEVLRLPTSSVTIARGHKAREKTLVVPAAPGKAEDEVVEGVRAALEEAAEVKA